jgi:GTPase SAR1 family protein
MRKRSVSIYAKSVEDYLESVRENRESDVEETENDDLNGLKCPQCENISSENINCEIIHSAEDEERDILESLESINHIYKNKSEVKEKGMDLLCSYFKDNIKRLHNDSNPIIHASNRRFPRSMSNSSLNDLNMKEILDTIVKNQKMQEEEDLESEKISHEPHKKRGSVISIASTCGSNYSYEMLAKNVECEEEIIKVMMIGSTLTGKTQLINNFLESRKNTYEPSIGLDIKKKVVNILNKKVRIEFYDTDANFHLKDTSKIYYKLCDAFIYVADNLKKESFEYIKNIHNKIFDLANSNSFFLICLNSDSQNFADEYNLNTVQLGDVSNFHIKNQASFNLFSSILIRKNKKKNKKNSSFRKSPVFSLNLVVEPCFGYSKEYKLEQSFDNLTISLNSKRKNRYSEPIFTR